MELNEKLVALRKKKGLSQAELAEAINVSRQAISRWEVGTAIPSADNLMWLSKFYVVSMDELMGVATDGEQRVSEEEKVADIKKGSSQRLLVIVCVLILSVAIVIWAIFSVFQRSEKGTVDLDELDSETYLPGNVIDMDVMAENF